LDRYNLLKKGGNKSKGGVKNRGGGRLPGKQKSLTDSSPGNEKKKKEQGKMGGTSLFVTSVAVRKKKVHKPRDNQRKDHKSCKSFFGGEKTAWTKHTRGAEFNCKLLSKPNVILCLINGRVGPKPGPSLLGKV